MADDLRPPYSSFLFSKDDGTPINFFLRPSVAKARLKPLIKLRGGSISSDAKLLGKQDFVRLAVDEETVTSDDYIRVQYIDDCVEANELLPMDKYRVSQRQPKPPSPSNSILNASVKGRIKYNSSEDTAILAYIAKHPDCSYSGNQIWRKMELLKITDHPWQSMRDRFKRKLVEDLSHYIKSQEEKAEKDVPSSPEDCRKGAEKDTEANSSTSIQTEASVNTPSKAQTQPDGLATDDGPSTSESELTDYSKDSNPQMEALESSNETYSDLDNYLIQVAEETAPNKIECSSKETKTMSDSAEECPRTRRRRHRSHQISSDEEKKHTEPNGEISTESTEETTDDKRRLSKRMKRRHSYSSETDELVDGVLADSEPDSSEESSTDPHFQARVNQIIAFVKEVVEDYSVPTFTVLQLLYFHSLDLKAVLNHLKTGESDVVWTKENDDKLNSCNPAVIKELCSRYSQHGVMKRQAFFNV